MSIHETHCNNCFSLVCENQSCLIGKCQFCKILLHQCKIEEHVSEICRKAEVKCPNSENGCPKQLIREKIGAHLEKCCASVVVCNRDRARKIVTNECKLALKKLGKQEQYLNVEQDMDMDLKIAAHDQNQIVKSYNSSRRTRVRQRDPLNPAHPLIPLRDIAFDTSVIGPVDEDSSEDERIERREKIKKSKLVFANCYMCQIDPSVQHLHTLGNGSEMERARKRRITPKEIDAFHEKHKLKIDCSIETIPECSIKGENIREIKKGGTMYTLKCLKTLRRLEWGRHNLFQHSLTVDQMDNYILRCPNWMQGCQFYSSRLITEHGNLKFDSQTSTIVFEPKVYNEKSENNSLNFENLPLWVYEELCNYLPTSAIYNLSMVSKLLRFNIFVGCQSVLYVEPVWVKANQKDGWKHDGFKWKFSSDEPIPDLKWNVPSDLSEHIGQCPYFNGICYDEERVPIFSTFNEEIIEGFGCYTR